MVETRKLLELNTIFCALGSSLFSAQGNEKAAVTFALFAFATGFMSLWIVGESMLHIPCLARPLPCEE